MLGLCEVLGSVAARPHACGVPGRRLSGLCSQVRVYTRPVIKKVALVDVKRLGKVPQAPQHVVLNVLTLALSLAILLSHTLPAPARDLQVASVSQQDALYGRRDSRPKVTRSIREEINAVTKLTSEAEAAINNGDMSQALEKYTSIVKEYPDLALAERARIKRALMLYETGAVEQALLELEDEEIALRGNAEVHAALAALLYAEKPSERQRAEQQWEVCCEFDNRYSSIEWVASNKMWGPRLLQALQKFLRLE